MHSECPQDAKARRDSQGRVAKEVPLTERRMEWRALSKNRNVAVVFRGNSLRASRKSSWSALRSLELATASPALVRLSHEHFRLAERKRTYDLPLWISGATAAACRRRCAVSGPGYA